MNDSKRDVCLNCGELIYRHSQKHKWMHATGDQELSEHCLALFECITEEEFLSEDNLAIPECACGCARGFGASWCKRNA